MAEYSKVLVNTGLLYARMLITVGVTLYSTRLTLAALGVDDFGLFSLVGGVVAMLGFLSNSMAATTQRYLSLAHGSKDYERLQRVFASSVRIHLLIAVVVLIGLEVVGSLLFRFVLKIDLARIDSVWLVFQFAVFSSFLTVLVVPYDSVISARENMFFVAVLGVVEALLKLLSAVFLSQYDGDRLLTYGLLISIVTVCCSVIKFAYCYSNYEECRSLRIGREAAGLSKEISSFAGWSMLGIASGMIAYYGQGAVLNAFFGAAVNAAQAVSNQVSGQLGAFASTLLKALNPMIARTEGAGDRLGMLKASVLGSKLSFFLLMIFYVPVLVEMKQVLSLWLGQVPDFAVELCRLLLLRNLIEQLFITLATSISAVGDIRKYQIIMAALNISPLLIAIGFFSIGEGPPYLYWSFMAYSVMALFITIVFAHRKCGLNSCDYLINVVGRCLFAFFMAISTTYLLTLLVNREPGYQVFGVVAFGVAAAFVSVFAIGLDRVERASFLFLFRSVINKVAGR